MLQFEEIERAFPCNLGRRIRLLNPMKQLVYRFDRLNRIFGRADAQLIRYIERHCPKGRTFCFIVKEGSRSAR